MKLEDLGELLEAVDDALAYLDRRIDCVTDPMSDGGAQVMNEAGQIHSRLHDIAATVGRQYDAALAERAVCRAEYMEDR